MPTLWTTTRITPLASQWSKICSTITSSTRASTLVVTQATTTSRNHQPQLHFSKTTPKKINKIAIHLLEKRDGQLSKRKPIIKIKHHKTTSTWAHIARIRILRDFQVSKIIWRYNNRIRGQQLMIQITQRLTREVTYTTTRVDSIIATMCRSQPPTTTLWITT